MTSETVRPVIWSAAFPRPPAKPTEPAARQAAAIIRATARRPAMMPVHAARDAIILIASAPLARLSAIAAGPRFPNGDGRTASRREFWPQPGRTHAPIRCSSAYCSSGDWRGRAFPNQFSMHSSSFSSIGRRLLVRLAEVRICGRAVARRFQQEEIRLRLKSGAKPASHCCRNGGLMAAPP